MLPKQRSNGLLEPTTGGRPSGQKFSTKGTLPRSPITTGKLKVLIAKDVDELQADLCDLIVEIRKENGEQYPPSSMYDLISGLSLYLEREHGFTNKLVSGAFRSVRNTLDNIMKERTAEGVGGRPERDPILEEHEQLLWEKGILGEDSPDKLRQTVFFLIGVRFGLRGLKEQYDLRRYPDSQINIVKIDGKDALVYREFQSKTRWGDI